MSDKHSVTAVGMLADPVRRQLYDYVASRHQGVTRDEAAHATGLSASKAKFHLDRLETEGLLDTEYRRISGRTGPGAGRPSKLYRRAAREFSVLLPQRRYDVAGSILAQAVTQSQHGTSLAQAIEQSAYARGVADAGAAGQQRPTLETVAQHAAPSGAHEEAPQPVDNARRMLASLGYEPEVRDADIVLHNCPFDALVDEHRDLVCAMNQHYVRGALDACGATGLESHASPEPGMCCVVARSTRT